MMHYKIRDACLTDISEVQRIEEAVFSIPMTSDQISSLLPDTNHIMLVAEQDDIDHKILGYAEVTVILDEGYISNIAVREESRRNGIAAAMLQKIVSDAQNCGLSFVSLEVRESNTPAIALYSRFSFIQAGLLKNHYRLPKENGLIMTRYFKNQEDGGNH